MDPCGTAVVTGRKSDKLELIRTMKDSSGTIKSPGWINLYAVVSVLVVHG